jgi:hypothetical protein
MPIKFQCPHCKRGLSVKDELAGKSGPCPGCKNILTVPGGPAAASNGPAPATPCAAPRSPEQSGKGKTRTASVPPAPSPRRAAQPQDLEAEVAALLLDDTIIDDAQPAFIDFPCPFCITKLHLGVELAGRQISCPNPACRRILHVPKPLNAKRTGQSERH